MAYFANPMPGPENIEDLELRTLVASLNASCYLIPKPEAEVTRVFEGSLPIACSCDDCRLERYRNSHELRDA